MKRKLLPAPPRLPALPFDADRGSKDEGPAYEVGYKKPPQHTRFKPGRSGNPRGRPRGSRNALVLLRKILDEKVNVTEGGTKKTMSKREVTVRTWVTKAVKGDQKAAERIMELDERASWLYPQPSETKITVRFIEPNGRQRK